jgi:LacI family transcriptional regulator
MSTITEIAERAGVSTKTVSRVLNNYPHISRRTRERVEGAIRELRYAPRSVASRIGLEGAPSLGVLYSDPGSGYQVRVNQALLEACSEAGMFLAVELFDETSQEWRAQVEAFLDRTQVQRLVLVPPMCDSSDLHSFLQERGVRCVLISPSRPVSGIKSIAMDDRLAAMEMTRHLIELGHRRIGVLTGDPRHVATLLRLQGCEEAFANAGLPAPDESLVLAGGFNFKRALRCAEQLLSRPNRPTAVFASNDEMAAAVIMVANHLGLSVPGDLSVAGFDDSAISQTIWPELTTVAQPYEAMARLAIELLCQPGQDAPAAGDTRVLPHRLLLRASTGPVSSR